MTTGSVRGKCSVLQLGHSRFQPPLTRLRRRAAIGTEAVARVPVQHGLGLGDRRQVLGVDQALDGDRAQVGDEKVAARFQRFGGGRRDADAETRGAIERAEKDRFGRRRQRARLVERKQRRVERGAFARHDHLAANDVGAGLGVGSEPIDRGSVGAEFGGALDAAAGISEAWFRTEIGARGHWRQIRTVGQRAQCGPETRMHRRISPACFPLPLARYKSAGGWRWTSHSPTGSGPEGSSPNEHGSGRSSASHPFHELTTHARGTSAAAG